MNEEYKDCRDEKGNFIRCPICYSEEHTDGRCESGTETCRDYDKR